LCHSSARRRVLSSFPTRRSSDLRDRASFEFALVSVAVGLDIGDGVIHDARLAAGGVGTKPWRLRTAEEALNGGPATPETYRAAADRKSTRLNSSHVKISYAVFCL